MSMLFSSSFLYIFFCVHIVHIIIAFKFRTYMCAHTFAKNFVVRQQKEKKMSLNLKQRIFLLNSIYIPIHKIHTYAKPCYKHPPLRIISHQAINIQQKKIKIYKVKRERERILIIVFQYLIHIFLFISFILFMVDLHLDENHAIIRNASV